MSNLPKITLYNASVGTEPAIVQRPVVYFSTFFGMEPFGVFRLLAEPAVIHGFVLFKMDRHIIFPYT